MVFVESRDGMDFTGNIFRIVEELSEKYSNLKICLYIKENIKKRTLKIIKKYNLRIYKIVTREALAVAEMEKAKYIISDSGIPWRYVKREGQIVLNTWHGTPLKLMGKYVDAEKHLIGTVQHFFLSSDYLLFPSKYMRDVMLDSYMVENLMNAKVILSGYPRNSVFFNIKKRQNIREKLGYKNKKIFVYMPTHRGNITKMKNNQQLEDVIDYLSELDVYLKEDQLLVVKLHIFNQSQIDFSQFEHIVPFPEEYECYDVLNATDCLITDYSSVMFDYANTHNKIILFTYDQVEYFSDRGTYFSLEELPFPKVNSINELLQEMNSEKNYNEDEFIAKYCPYDSFNATSVLCEHIFLNKKILHEERLGNGKENVLIMGGSLAKNGITTALVNLLNNIDTDKRNYFVTFKRWEVNKDIDRVNVIPKHINYIPLMSDHFYTFSEKIAFKKYCANNEKMTLLPSVLRRLFQREVNRYFSGAKFSHVIQFDGYGKDVILLFNEINAKRTIFVHNDMIQELKNKNIQHYPTLNYAYRTYDRVAVVTEDIIEPTKLISERKDNIVVINNIHDFESVNKRALLPIEFDKDTECITNNVNGIKGVLQSKGKKFITIGRFSQEKGHERLIKAFDKFCDEYEDTQLIIIGGHGVLYNQTVRLARNAKHWKNITIIKSIKNPMPILRKCDLFVLSSLYEGLALVLLEADCMGIPESVVVFL